LEAIMILGIIFAVLYIILNIMEKWTWYLFASVWTLISWAVIETLEYFILK